MNELQIALALIGVLAVIGILIYNRLQERKFRRQTEAGFARPGRDALLDGEPGNAAPAQTDSGFHDPVIRDAATGMFHGRGGNEPHFGDTEMLLEAVLGEYPVQSPAPIDDEPSGYTPPPATANYEELIEFRAVLKNLEGMPAAMFSDLQTHSAALGKPVRWLALPLGSPVWEELSAQSGKRYLEAQITMQLADRDGAAEKEKLSALCEMAQELALAHDWQVRCDDPAEAAAKAQSLDKFCADVDVQIGLNIVARGTATLPIARIRREAEHAGMQLARNGVYQLLDSRGEVLFMLASREAQAFALDDPHEPETRGVTLLFDVPRVPDGLKNFDSMVTLGRKLAHEGSGLLVDDNLRPLTDTGIEKIRAQLAQIYARMEARGVPAGSRVALRLFS